METSRRKLSEQEILQLISQLKINPSNRYKILADLGIASAGMAGAGAVAAVAGTTIVPIGWGVTALTGLSLVAAAPVGLVAGAAVAGGAVTYGIAQAIRWKAHKHGKDKQIIQQLNEKLRDLKYAEKKAQVTDEEKTNFILFLEEPIKHHLISSDDASELIQIVENGQMSLVEAYKLIKDVLDESKSELGSNLSG